MESIWRGRFSYDLDVYVPPEDLERVKEILQRSFPFRKFKTTTSGTTYQVIYEEVEISLEISPLQEPKSTITRQWELIDGTTIPTIVLTPEELIIEKVQAYLSRRKGRDLYDIWVLLPYIKDIDYVYPYLQELLQNFVEPPDWDVVRELIVRGRFPTVQEVLRNIKYLLK